MSAAQTARRLPELQQLAQLCERRLRSAEAELAEARAQVERERQALATCDAQIARIDAAKAALAAWFEDQPDPRYLDAALARRGVLVSQGAQALAARGEAEAALVEAMEAQAEASRAVARAKGRLDVAEGQVADARRARAGLAEAAAEIEQEERTRPSVMGGAFA